MKLKLQLKKPSGRELIYPVCKNSKKLTEFSGRKTFTEYDLKLLKAVGFEIEVKRGIVAVELIEKRCPYCKRKSMFAPLNLKENEVEIFCCKHCGSSMNGL